MPAGSEAQRVDLLLARTIFAEFGVLSIHAWRIRARRGPTGEKAEFSFKGLAPPVVHNWAVMGISGECSQRFQRPIV